MKTVLAILLGLALLAPAHAQDRSGPLRIEITEGVIEPIPIAVAPFIAENAGAADYAREITGVVASGDDRWAIVAGGSATSRRKATSARSAASTPRWPMPTGKR